MYHSRLMFALAMAALAGILVPSTLTAQTTFQRTYGGTGSDQGNSVQQTTDGGYIIAGTTDSYGAGDTAIYLIKTDAYGDTLWTRTLGGVGEDRGFSVQQTSDGGYVVAGYTWSFGAGNTDVYLVKTDANGDTLWTRTYGGALADVGCAVRQTTDSGYVIAGYTYSFGAGGRDAYLIKTDASGDTLWTRTYGDTLYELARSVQQTPDGGYVFTGYKGSRGMGDRQVFIVKTDADGDTIWTKTYGGPSKDEGNCIDLTHDGGYIVVGYTLSFGAGERDVYVLRTNSVGDTTWTRTFGSINFEEGYSVAQTDDDGFVVVGYTEYIVPPVTEYMDVYLIKTDANGDTMWTRTFGRGDVGYSVQQTADGGYVIAGITSSFGAGGDDVYLIKTDSLGTLAVAESKASPTRAPALSLTCEPNPSSGSVTISLSPSIPLSPSPVLRIYDSQGRMVLSRPISTSPFPLSTSDLTSGTYFVRLDVTGMQATARLVLQH